MMVVDQKKVIDIVKGLSPALQKAKPATVIKLNDYDFMRLHTNEMEMEIPSFIQDLIQDSIAELWKYPDENCLELRSKIGEFYGLTADNVITGNGSADLLNLIYRTFIKPGDEITELVPNFGYCQYLAHICEAKLQPIAWPIDGVLDVKKILEVSERSKFIIFSNPNNPTGTMVSMDDIDDLLTKTNQLVIIDEAYADFAEDNALKLIEKHSNLLILRTLSKGYGLAGARLGYAFGHPTLINCLLVAFTPFGISAPIQAMGMSILANHKFFQSVRNEVIENRDLLRIKLISLGFSVLPSKTNFLFAQVPERTTALKWVKDLLDEKISVAHFSLPGYEEYIRIGISSRENMDLFLKVIQKISHRYTENHHEMII